MSYLTRLFKFVYGFFLFTRFTKKLDLNDIVKGKRVAIIGAANSTQGLAKGNYIDSFDIVIRLNKAPFVLSKGLQKEDIGSKADILFHSFFENEVFGGGPINLELYQQLNIKYIINPLPTYL